MNARRKRRLNFVTTRSTTHRHPSGALPAGHQVLPARIIPKRCSLGSRGGPNATGLLWAGHAAATGYVSGSRGASLCNQRPSPVYATVSVSSPK